MRMVQGLTLLVLASLTGCSGGSDSITSVDTRNTRTSLPTISMAATRPTVTGHANMILPHFGGAVQRYSVSAIRLPDGSVRGEWEVRSDQGDGVRVHGRIVCMTTAGNAALLVGFAERGSDPRFVGWHYYWSVVDNGEGANAPPDLTSDFFPFRPEFLELVCSFPADPFADLPVVGGNLVVR